MSLNPLHEHLARLVFELPEAAGVAIAGGSAMLIHNLVERPTQDLDLFTPDEAEVDSLTAAIAQALRAEGATVDFDRRGPGFTRLAATMADGQSVAVEIAQDARIRPAVQLSFGRVIDPDEVAADKTLALFGRAAARDLVDVAALSARYPLDQLCRLAAEKDPGFDRRVLADALRAAASHPDDGHRNPNFRGFGCRDVLSITAVAHTASSQRVSTGSARHRCRRTWLGAEPSRSVCGALLLKIGRRHDNAALHMGISRWSVLRPQLRCRRIRHWAPS